MTNRKDLDFGKLVYGIVEGGHKDDPDPEKAGRMRVRRFDQGPLVDHLPFLQSLSNPNADGNTEFNRPPRPGTLVTMLKTIDGYAHVLGIPQGIKKNLEGSNSGGKPLESMIPQIQKAVEMTTGIRIPPNIIQKLTDNRTGLQKLIKELQEKGQEDSTKLYEGIPSHGAIASLAGLITDPVKQVSTALTEAGLNLDSNLLSSLTGSLGNVGGILDQLQSQLEDALPSGTMGSVNALKNLLQSELSITMPGNFMFGGRMNIASMLPNILSKFTKATNFGDLDDIIHGILTDKFDETLHDLEDVVSDVIDIFGDAKVTLKANGHVSVSLSSGASALQSAFSSLLSSIPSPTGQLFDSNSKIPDLIKRLKKAALTAAKENLEDKHPSKTDSRNHLKNGGTKGTTLGTTVLGHV